MLYNTGTMKIGIIEGTRKPKEADYYDQIFHEEDDKEISKQLKLEAFGNLSGNMQEALFTTIKLFEGVRWKLVGSNASIVRGETTRQSVDIDIHFLKEDTDRLLNKLREYAGEYTESIVKNLKKVDVKDFEGKEGGTRISFEVRSNTPPYTYTEVEAFAQNPKEGSRQAENWNEEDMNVEVQKENEKFVLPVARRKEIVEFYLTLAETELEEHQFQAHLFETHQIKEEEFLQNFKYKLPQRFENVLAAILRQKRKEFEKDKKEGKRSPDEVFNKEEISDEDINKFVKLFDGFNESVRGISEPKLVNLKVKEFLQKRSARMAESQGFIQETATKLTTSEPKTTTRESVLDSLTKEIAGDMQGIVKAHINLGKIKKSFERLADKCKNPEQCDEATIEEIKGTEDLIKISIDGVLNNIKLIQEKYNDYLSKINFNDNRDIIPYISITHVLDNYITPSIELALALEKDVQTQKQL